MGHLEREIEIGALSVIELLRLHTRIAGELRSRGIARTSNNPTGDLAEYLFCKAFDWHQVGNGRANIDATDSDERTYQIKARRVTRHNKSRQLSAIRDLAGGHFDFLAGVIFSEDFAVLRAAIIPHDVVQAQATFVGRTNSHKFLLRDEVWSVPSVRDVTAEIETVINTLLAGGHP